MLLPQLLLLGLDDGVEVLLRPLQTLGGVHVALELNTPTGVIEYRAPRASSFKSIGY